MKRRNTNSIEKNRSKFIKKTGIAILGSSVAFNIGHAKAKNESNEKTLKVGLVGCGGRGSGAAGQALSADPDVVLTAMADGDLPPDVGRMFIESIASIVKIDEYTELKDRIDNLEGVLNGESQEST